MIHSLRQKKIKHKINKNKSKTNKGKTNKKTRKRNIMVAVLIKNK